MHGANEQTGGSACRVGSMLGSVCAAVALVMLSATGWAASEPGKPVPTLQPWVTMSLGSLGVPAIPQSFIQVGSSMLTLHLVDDTHLLLTFSSRGLVPRDKDDLPDEECRMVRAELVELPTGKILAQADWKMHDHGRYLWRLGNGRFLMRTRNDLFLITPLARLNTAEPLRPIRFPTRDGVPVTAVISPDKAMLMVETVPPKKKANVMTAAGTVVVNESKPSTVIDFYRLSGGDAPGVPLTLKGAGVVKAPGPLVLPMDEDGYLWPNEVTHGRWPVSFNEFGGREVKIVGVESSCEPRLQMVSRFEFLAFTCKGGSDSRVRMKSYGMDGHETWEDTLSGTYGTPEMAFAPAAGRFALSRIVSATGDMLLGQMIPDGATQEVRVYQTESGDVLLKVPTTPVTRYAENFDLSEDGMLATVITDGTVQVYKLPAPSAQDVKDLEEAKGFSPPVSNAPVKFAKLETRGGAPDSSEVAQGGSSAVEKEVESAVRTAVGSPSAGGGDAPSGAGDGKEVDSAAAGAAAPAATATAASEGEVGVAPPGAEVTKASGAKDPANEISDEEAARALGARLAGADAGPKPAAGAEAAAGQNGAGGDAPKRSGPPTLLQPGENVEKVKPPTQQQPGQSGQQPSVQQQSNRQ